MIKGKAKRIMTDVDVKRKAIKLVITHLKKKTSKEFSGSDNVNDWVGNMEELLNKDDFEISEYHSMRKKLNDVIERTFDEEIRFKLRDSWFSLGKAIDKKAKIN